MTNALVVFEGKRAVPVDQLHNAVIEWLQADMEKADNLRYAVGMVFSYWVAKTQRRASQTLLSPERATKIRQRITEQGPGQMADLVSPLLWAIDGVMASDYHVEHGHTDLTLVLRDRSHLERFAEAMQGYRNEKLHPLIYNG